MNLYDHKQRWKIALLGLALCIVVASLWYSNRIVNQIRQEENLKVKNWSSAVKRQAYLVNFQAKIFAEFRTEEQKKASLLGSAYRTIQNQNISMDQVDLPLEIIRSNETVPILLFDMETDTLIASSQLPEPSRASEKAYIDSLRTEMKNAFDPIIFEGVNIAVYYDESNIFRKLQRNFSEIDQEFFNLIESTGTIPIVLTDSTKKAVIRKSQVEADLSQPAVLEVTLERMAEANEPIRLDLPDGTRYVYFDDSEAVKNLRLFPIIQFILIGVFLLTAYLIFSTFRKAEQNQVWVGMAKETAHQLGTPLSSLMAWSALLETQGVDGSTIKEINKDIDRLNTVTDRFSKIGSTPELKPTNIRNTVHELMDYLKSRVSKKVMIQVHAEAEVADVKINKPLFGWAIENIVKNAIDAMDGSGRLDLTIGQQPELVWIEIKDTGKGIPKNQWMSVFAPGFTTKKRGWGLGLTLVKRIVEEYHGGKIFVKESTPGEGTTFRIELSC
ncbi:MAG: sensor histidine kinase [Flavobacteriales bacterium]